LLLDDVETLSSALQNKLWRVLRERKFERVGGREPVEVDVRLISASRQDLKEAVAQGRFRQDLCDQLAAVQVVVPPLRERREDVLVIAEHVLEIKSGSLGRSPKGFSQPSRELLLHYSFPGNVGELEQMVERAVTLGRDGEPLQPWDLCGFQSCPYLGGAPRSDCGFCTEGLSAKTGSPEVHSAATLATAREAFEKDYIETVLKQVDGSRTAAAAVLGLSRKALWDKCKRYGISSAKGEAEERDE
jgi:DNA-binding NtrC family response regulator